MTAETTIKTLAAEMSQQFETRKRDDETEYVALKEGYPQWMQDVCHAAHGEMMPDDLRYHMIREAVDAVAEHDDTDEARDSIEPPIYTHELTGWLHSRADRGGYVDGAVEEWGHKWSNLNDALTIGYQAEQTEVFDLILAALEKRVSDEAEEAKAGAAEAKADEDRLRRLEAEGEAEADNESDDAE